MKYSRENYMTQGKGCMKKILQRSVTRSKMRRNFAAPSNGKCVHERLNKNNKNFCTQQIFRNHKIDKKLNKS